MLCHYVTLRRLQSIKLWLGLLYYIFVVVKSVAQAPPGEFFVHCSIMHLTLLGGLLLATSSTAALAFDPNAGAVEVRTPAMYRPLPASIVPQRYYQHAPVAASAPTYRAPDTAPYQPAEPIYTPINTLAPLPMVSAPSYSVPLAPELPPAPAPALMQVPNNYTPPQRTIVTADRFTLGIEGFYDEYQEDSVSLVDEGYFAGVTASYEHFFQPDWYGAVEIRAARGSTDYESVSGTIDNISQWDTETRLLAGYSPTYYQQGRTKFYAGLGARYFSDELKGKTSSLGDIGYDRRIFQLYVPIGITYEFAAYGLTFAPNVEVDKLLWGNVSSRLGTIPGFTNIENEQTEGYGLRGELMMGQMDERGRGWQFGPFVRYWDIPDSKVDAGFIEPENTRIQAGANLKYAF